MVSRVEFHVCRGHVDVRGAAVGVPVVADVQGVEHGRDCGVAAAVLEHHEQDLPGQLLLQGAEPGQGPGVGPVERSVPAVQVSKTEEQPGEEEGRRCI